MASSRRMLCPSHGGGEGERGETRYREEARRRHSEGRGEKAGPALHPLRTARHMAAACWIQTGVTLKALQSRLSFPSSSQLSDTITYSPLCFSSSLPSGPLLCSFSLLCAAIRSPSSITPLLNICFGRVALWLIFPYSLLLQIHNNAQVVHPTVPGLHALTDTHAYASRPYMHQQPCNVLARDPRLAPKTNADPGV